MADVVNLGALRLLLGALRLLLGALGLLLGALKLLRALGALRQWAGLGSGEQVPGRSLKAPRRSLNAPRWHPCHTDTSPCVQTQCLPPPPRQGPGPDRAVVRLLRRLHCAVPRRSQIASVCSPKHSSRAHPVPRRTRPRPILHSDEPGPGPSCTRTNPAQAHPAPRPILYPDGPH
eukprot:gene6640-biopygen11913